MSTNPKAVSTRKATKKWREKNPEYMKEYCKRPEVIAAKKEWEKNNPEKIKEKNKKYRNRSEVKIRQKEWRKNNPDRVKKSQKKWLQDKNNLKTARKAVKNWQQNNPERVLVAVIKWQKNNPEKVLAEQEAQRKIKLLPLCELCPEDDKQPATQRHHPDYNYPLIIVSCCASCHKYADKKEIMVEV